MEGRYRYYFPNENQRALPIQSMKAATLMKVIFLEAKVPLTKTFTQKAGDLTKTPYPFVWEFSSHEESIASLNQFEVHLQAHAALGHCLLKGTIRKPLILESRAGSTDTNSQTEWAVLDLDGLPEHIDDTGVRTTVTLFLNALGLKDVSYVLQWSASYGIQNQKIRAHIFFMLDKPTAAPLLKQWLIHLNHSTPMLNAALTLTKTGNALSWPLDVSACQNDKLIYIAPPVLKGIKDPMPGGRIMLVKRKLDKLSITGNFSNEKNRELTEKRLSELREIDGLPKRKFKTRMHGSTEIVIKPDGCTITEMKTERGFVYFNLNGGDSWAYYHPENNPDFILNFKGEPAYLTKELLPDYWSDLAGQTVRVASNGLTYLAFCDRATSAYWRGTYDQALDILDLNIAKNETQLRHFALQHGMPLGDFIPEWDLSFDPHDSVRVDFTNRTINTFTLSPYMKAVAKKVTTIPRTIYKVIYNAVGSDQRIMDHFINWLAFILQERDRTRTAWVLHGTTGTGKGVLCTNILRPIFGPAHTASRRMEELNEQYNHFMRNSLLVFVDEVQTKALQNERGVMAKLKNFITEPLVTIRQMYSNATECRNYTNWIFNSNMADPVSIPAEDRRYNVGKYQPNKLVLTQKEVDELIPSELQAFHDYLLNFRLNKDQASTVIETDDRTTLISISESSVDTVSNALLKGNFEFFMDQLPAGVNYNSDFGAGKKLEDYKHVLRLLLQRTDPASGKCGIAREELRVLYDFVSGSMPTTPNKFTSLLKHHRIHIDKVWVDNKTVNGIKTVWKDRKNLPSHLTALTPQIGGSKGAKAPPALKGKRLVVPISTITKTKR